MHPRTRIREVADTLCGGMYTVLSGNMRDSQVFEVHTE